MSKTIKQKIGEGVFWLSVGNVLMKVVGISYIILVLSQLSVAEYGLVKLALSILPLLSILYLNGLESVMIADLVLFRTQNRFEEMRNLLSSYVSLMSILAMVGAVGLFSVTLLFESYFNEGTILMVRLLPISLLFGPVRSLISISCNVTHSFSRFAFFSLSEEVFKFFLVAIFLLVFDLGPLAIILAFVISDIVVTSFFVSVIFLMKRQVFSGQLFSSYLFRPMYVIGSHAKWGLFQGVLSSVGQNIRPWIIQYFLGIQAVGIYGLAISMFKHVSSLFPLSRVMAPIIPAYVRKNNKLTSLVNSTIKYQLLSQLVVIVLAIMLMPIIIDGFFPAFKPAYPLFIWLSLTLIPGSFSRIFEIVFHAMRLQKSLFTSHLIRFLIIATMLPLAVMMFGISGIAVEFMLTNVVYMLGRYKFLKRAIPSYSFPVKNLYTFTQTDKLLFRKLKEKFVR